MAVTDPAVFLRETPPFHLLPAELLDAAARAVEIARYPAGSRLARRGEEPLQHLYVIRQGSVRLERDGRTLQLLEEGEVFGYTSPTARQAPFDVVVCEDLLAYRLPRAQLDALLADARFAGHLVDSGVHHLPAPRGGETTGAVTSGDLLGATAREPVAVLRRVERLAAREQLPGHGSRVAEMAAALLAGGLEATAIAGFVARLNDALLGRIMSFGEAELGPPPCPYAWIAHGSEGRREQTLLTDQDNALIHADGGPAAADYFRRLAERANDDLEAAGFPRCPGGYMAREWRGPIGEWVERFLGWVADRRPQALMRAAIFADQRKIHGQLDLAPFEAAIRRAGKDRVFLLALAKAALDSRPPPSLFLRLRGESSEVNLKTRGLTPIVHLARCYGLEVGAESRGTLPRLDAAVRAGIMGPEARARVGEAFRFLLGLRLRLQLRRVAGGRSPGSAVQLAELSPGERSQLRESFRSVRWWQDQAAYRYRTDLF